MLAIALVIHPLVLLILLLVLGQLQPLVHFVIVIFGTPLLLIFGTPILFYGNHVVLHLLLLLHLLLIIIIQLELPVLVVVVFVTIILLILADDAKKFSEPLGVVVSNFSISFTF
jgi:hypothetical protein